ncbi:MAG: hypothetical protein AABX13_00315 [Nanoarchaeota archaeon]
MVKLINLDNSVLNALRFFTKAKLPSLPASQFTRPLVVGSGNAAVTGKILFQDADAVFADESTYLQKLKTVPDIDGAVLISASGGKHAPIIAREVHKRKLNVILMTNNPASPASQYATKTSVFPKLPEPYTYNTSTYLGLILAKTKEDPKAILQHLEKLPLPQHLVRYDAFFLLVPERFELIRELFLTKFDELFGPVVSGRVFTPEQAKHAKTIVPSPKELFISFGWKNTVFGKNRIHVPLPMTANYGTLMAVGYYIIGQIQQQHPPYFKRNIERYVQEASKLFGEKIKVVVE